MFFYLLYNNNLVIYNNFYFFFVINIFCFSYTLHMLYFFYSIIN